MVVKRTSDVNASTEETVPRTDRQCSFGVDDHTVSFDMTITCDFRLDGVDYHLLKVSQHFEVLRQGGRETIVPTRWTKGPPDAAINVTKGAPALHPLLSVDNLVVTVAFDFVDITSLFDAVHGNTPWFMALTLLKGTERTMKVLASLRGHPFVWHVLIPGSTATTRELKPNLLIYPADYGGISYPADSIAGIKSASHNTSVGNIQCGGETLFSFVAMPLADDQYEGKLEAYLSMTSRFKGRTGRNPPPLHRLRDTLGYEARDGKLTPKYWDVPFGFERGIFDSRQILLIPQINGADGGIAIKAGLKKTIEGALLLIYTHGHAFQYDTVSIGKTVLTCYSQSGGNAFTACQRNMDDVRALICFEPQYMNVHLKGEDKSLTLGKDVIPLFLRAGGKVVIVARHEGGWAGKYLPPTGAQPNLWILPDEAHKFLLDYPDPSKTYSEGRSPVWVRRYARLLRGAADPVIASMLTKETGIIDLESAEMEAAVDAIIASFRKRGLSDEQIIKAVFLPSFNADVSGGFYTHNFIVSSGQERASDGRSTFAFFQQAVALTG